jgi:hypothetical protein
MSRRLFPSPLHWLAVLVWLAAVVLVQYAWGGGWAVVPIVLGPFLVYLVDLRILGPDR